MQAIVKFTFLYYINQRIQSEYIACEAQYARSRVFMRRSHLVVAMSLLHFLQVLPVLAGVWPRRVVVPIRGRPIAHRSVFQSASEVEDSCCNRGSPPASLRQGYHGRPETLETEPSSSRSDTTATRRRRLTLSTPSCGSVQCWGRCSQRCLFQPASHVGGCTVGGGTLTRGEEGVGVWPIWNQFHCSLWKRRRCNSFCPELPWSVLS